MSSRKQSYVGYQSEWGPKDNEDNKANGNFSSLYHRSLRPSLVGNTSIEERQQSSNFFKRGSDIIDPIPDSILTQELSKPTREHDRIKDLERLLDDSNEEIKSLKHKVDRREEALRNLRRQATIDLLRAKTEMQSENDVRIMMSNDARSIDVKILELEEKVMSCDKIITQQSEEIEKLRLKIHVDHQKFIESNRNLQQENFMLADHVNRIEHDKRNLMNLSVVKDSTITSQVKDIERLEAELLAARQESIRCNDYDEISSKLASAKLAIKERDETIRELMQDKEGTASVIHQTSPRITQELDELRKRHASLVASLDELLAMGAVFGPGSSTGIGRKGSSGPLSKSMRKLSAPGKGDSPLRGRGSLRPSSANLLAKSPLLLSKGMTAAMDPKVSASEATPINTNTTPALSLHNHSRKSPTKSSLVSKSTAVHAASRSDSSHKSRIAQRPLSASVFVQRPSISTLMSTSQSPASTVPGPFLSLNKSLVVPDSNLTSSLPGPESLSVLLPDETDHAPVLSAVSKAGLWSVQESLEAARKEEQVRHLLDLHKKMLSEYQGAVDEAEDAADAADGDAARVMELEKSLQARDEEIARLTAELKKTQYEISKQSMKVETLTTQNRRLSEFQRPSRSHSDDKDFEFNDDVTPLTTGSRSIQDPRTQLPLPSQSLKISDPIPENGPETTFSPLPMRTNESIPKPAIRTSVFDSGPKRSPSMDVPGRRVSNMDSPLRRSSQMSTPSRRTSVLAYYGCPTPADMEREEVVIVPRPNPGSVTRDLGISLKSAALPHLTIPLFSRAREFMRTTDVVEVACVQEGTQFYPLTLEKSTQTSANGNDPMDVSAEEAIRKELNEKFMAKLIKDFGTIAKAALPAHLVNEISVGVRDDLRDSCEACAQGGPHSAVPGLGKLLCRPVSPGGASPAKNPLKPDEKIRDLGRKVKHVHIFLSDVMTLRNRLVADEALKPVWSKGTGKAFLTCLDYVLQTCNLLLTPSAQDLNADDRIQPPTHKPVVSAGSSTKFSNQSARAERRPSALVQTISDNAIREESEDEANSVSSKSSGRISVELKFTAPVAKPRPRPKRVSKDDLDVSYEFMAKKITVYDICKVADSYDSLLLPDSSKDCTAHQIFPPNALRPYPMTAEEKVNTLKRRQLVGLNSNELQIVGDKGRETKQFSLTLPAAYRYQSQDPADDKDDSDEMVMQYLPTAIEPDPPLEGASNAEGVREGGSDGTSGPPQPTTTAEVTSATFGARKGILSTTKRPAPPTTLPRIDLNSFLDVDIRASPVDRDGRVSDRGTSNSHPLPSPKYPKTTDNSPLPPLSSHLLTLPTPHWCPSEAADRYRPNDEANDVAEKNAVGEAMGLQNLQHYPGQSTAAPRGGNVHRVEQPGAPTGPPMAPSPNRELLVDSETRAKAAKTRGVPLAVVGSQGTGTRSKQASGSGSGPAPGRRGSTLVDRLVAESRTNHIQQPRPSSSKGKGSAGRVAPSSVTKLLNYPMASAAVQS